MWVSILGGPSYTPEASLGIGGAMLMTFRMNQQDTISQRSFIPVGFNISVNGTFVAAGAGTLFFNENKFRIYIKYGYRTEPSNFYGIGYDEIKAAENLNDLYGKDSVTFHKANVQFFPRMQHQPMVKKPTDSPRKENKREDRTPIRLSTKEEARRAFIYSEIFNRKY